MTSRLELQLKSLSLTKILAHYQEEAAKAAQEKSSYEAYLARLVEMEAMSKLQRSINAKIHKARFPALKTIEEFDFSFQPGLNEKEVIRLKTFSTVLSQVEETLKTKLLDLLQKNEFQPPSKEELSQSLKLDQKHLSDILKLMVKEGSLVRISDSMYLTSSAYNKMIEALKNFFSKKPEMTVAEFRDILTTTRKYALPILEYLDSNKITLRVGDVRKLLLKS